MKNNPTEISNYGTVQSRKEYLLRPELKNVFSIAGILTLIFIISDTVCLFTSFDTVQTENKYLVLILSCITAIILDVPAMLLGKCFKEYQQGLRGKKLTLIVSAASLGVFTLFIVVSAVFRVVTRGATFTNPEAATVINTVSQGTAQVEEGGDLAVLIASIFVALLPLGTSITSFVVALMCSNPLKDRIDKLEKTKILALNHQTALRQAIDEEEDLAEKANFLITKEELDYKFACHEVESWRNKLRSAVASAIKETLSDQEASEKAIELCQKRTELNTYEEPDFTEINNMVCGNHEQSSITGCNNCEGTDIISLDA